MSGVGAESLYIHLFGVFRLRVNGKLVDGRQWSRPRPKLIVKLLALQPHRQLHREQLMELLWPELGPGAASRNLNKAIHVARRALEPGLRSGGDSRFIVSRERQVLLTAPGDMWVDVEEFRNLATAAMGSQNPADYEAALETYQGDLLIEDLYEDWAAGPRERLRQLRQDLLARLAVIYEARGNYDRAISVLTNLLAEDPSNEEAHRAVMRLHAQSGNRHQALRQYRLCSEALRADLGEEPQPATVELFDQIASGRLLPNHRHAAESPRETGRSGGSLAILPFVNVNRDPELEYLSDGVTESIINSLSQVGRLRVMARSTVFRYKGDGVDPQAVGRELAVSSVLTGRVQVVGGTLVVGVELVDAGDGSHLWGEQYRKELKNIFELQEEVSAKISEQLQLRLSGDEQKRLVKRHTENAEAYQLYLKGRYFWNKRTRQQTIKAEECFSQAIEIDPNYALALTGLADCYILRGDVGVSVVASMEAFSKGMAAATRALEIDDALAEAHASMGHLRMHYYEWQEAEARFKQAIALNPNYVPAHGWYAYYLALTGRMDEAMSEIDKARQLDPLSLIINSDIGELLYFSRRYDEAIWQLVETLEMDPRYFRAHLHLGRCYVEKRMYGEALAEFQLARTLSEDSTEALAAIGQAHAASGRRDEAFDVMEELVEAARKKYVSPYTMAIVRAQLGEKDKALTLLEKAFEHHAEWIIYLTLDPKLDNLRDEPRFRELVRKLGLPEPHSTFSPAPDSHIQGGADPPVFSII